MNVVGECVSRPVPGRSIPRGASAPPQIRHVLRRPPWRRRTPPIEQREVGRRGDVVSGLVELRQPEAVQVRLVADDHVADLRHVAHDRGDVRGELRPRLGRERRRRRARVVDAEEDPRLAGPRGDVPQHGELLGGRRRQPRLPEARDPDGAEAGLLELVERRARDGGRRRRPRRRGSGSSLLPPQPASVSAASGERTGRAALARTTTARAAWRART